MAETQLACPRCKANLFGAKAGANDVYGCGACGGVWLDAGASQAMAEGRGVAILDLSDRADANKPTARPSLEATAYCPLDGLPLTRRDVAGVELDCCDHGTWFDAGEARRVAEGYRAWQARRHAAAAVQPAAAMVADNDPATTATAVEVGVGALEVGVGMLDVFVSILSIID